MNFMVEKTNVWLGANKFFVKLDIRSQYATIVFQTKMSVVFRIRESVVLYCMYLCLQTKMSVILNELYLYILLEIVEARI